MASYNADINVRINGVTQLDRIVDSVNQLNNLARKLSNTPLNVFGRGEAGDLKRTALKPLQDIARAIENGGTAASNTVAKTRLLANGFTDLAQNVKIGSRDYENFIRVAGRATVELDKQTAAFEHLLNAETRAARGLQPQEQRDLEVARRQTRRQSLRFRRAQGIAGTENIEQAIAATTSVEQRLNAIRRTSEEQLFNIKLSNLEELYAKELQLQKRNDAEALADFDRRLNARTRPSTQRKLGTAGSLRSGRLAGIAENTIIGGAFPLLFGQSGAAATGGALGGAIGGMFGGAGGFAGSLLGTLLGNIAGQANQVKELAADIGFSAKQTEMLGIAFKQAGADFDKFQESVSRIQGLGLTLEEQASAIQLASTLTEAYGGKIDKVTNAFTNALQTGKVTQATLNQLTSQSVPIQEALAKKYNVSRDALLQMAKDGKISVQDLLDTLVNLANESTKGPTQTSNAYKEAFDQINLAVDNLTTKIVNSFGFQSAAAKTTGDTIAYRIAGAFTTIIKAIEPVVTLLAETSGQVINLGIQFVSALSGVPSLISNVATAIINMIPGLGSVYTTLSLIQNLRSGGGRKPGIATALNLNQGMSQNWPEGIPRPGTPGTIGKISALGQLPPAGGGGGSKKTGADAAAKEAERAAKAIRDTQANTQFLALQEQLQQRIFAAEQARDLLLATRLKGEQEILKIQFDYAQKLSEETNIKVQQAIIQEGLLKQNIALADSLREQQKIETDRKKEFADRLTALDREIELNGITNDYARELRQIEFDILDLKKQGIIVNEQEAAQYRNRAKATKQTPAQKIYSGMQQELEQLITVENLAATGAKTIGDSFGRAFQQVMTGSASAQEALAGMMKSIGENFVNMAAQIIAQQITMIIFGTIMKALGLTGGLGSMGGGGGFGSWSGGNFGVDSTGMGGGLFGGDVLASGAGLYSGRKFAEGGYVNGPTSALIGEGGEPEYVIPASKMSAAMARYGAGARGASVIPDSGNYDTGATAPSIGGITVDVRYNVERINSVDYVTADEFQRGMATAAKQGAKQGEAATLRRLQQSTSTRSRLGMR